MSLRSLAVRLCLAFLLPFAALAQTPRSSQFPQASLTISCDADCSWSVDGDQHGALKKGEEARVEVLFGAHSIKATSSDGRHWERTVEIKQPNQVQVRISFAPSSSPGESGADAAVQAEKGVQSDEPARKIPTFYAQGRQVLVEAEVWNHVDQKGRGDASSVPQVSLESLPDGGATLEKTLKLAPPPARDLTAKDFHVLDNGEEQSINYFSESDFPASSTGQWILHPTANGIWGVLGLAGPGIGEAPSAIYLIGYVPPALQPGECRSIRIVVSNHYVQTNRQRYCTLGTSDAATELETKLQARMQTFATSAAQDSIHVSAKAFVFWSSGVMSLTTPAESTEVPPALPATAFTYVVNVHDSKAPATVQIATGFDLPHQLWDYPCPRRESSVYVLGMIYRANGELQGQFGDTYQCDMFTNPSTKPFSNVPGAKVIVPSLFDTQIELRPGEYTVRIVVSDGKKFGRAQVPLRVEPLEGGGLTLSDITLDSILRDASWIIRDAAKVTPNPLVPTPLVSKSTMPASVPVVLPLREDIQFLPAPGAKLWKNIPLSIYFEIYEPLLKAQSATVSYRMKITDLKTGALVLNTGPMSARNWMVPDNVVIPIGLELDTHKLREGSYELEVQASDSAGRETAWRQATFVIN